jgi:hypothetical protein
VCAHDLEKPRLDRPQRWREGVSARKSKDGKKGEVVHMIGRGASRGHRWNMSSEQEQEKSGQGARNRKKNGIGIVPPWKKWL